MMMRQFKLKYSNEIMEKEYTSLQEASNIDNIKLSFYFLIFLLSVPGIPAIIYGNYIDLAITILMGSGLFVIYFWKAIPRNHVQFIAAILICSFDNSIFLLPTTSLESLPKGIIYLRGYAFASINVALLTRFTSLRQKTIFLLYALAFRLTLMICLDHASAEAYAIIRSLYIDLYVAYSDFCQEKKYRTVFKRFFEYREELTKFKELLSDYFPQSITVFSNLFEKPLFSNRAYMAVFGQTEERIDSPNNSQIKIMDESGLPITQTSKIDIKYLLVDRNTIRKVGGSPTELGFSNDPIYLRDVVGQLVEKKILDEKPLSLSTYYVENNEQKSFEVILTKIKWDGKDAIAFILNDITYQEKLISLKISDKNKDQIIATVSHELRTPLNGIIGIIDMAEKRVNDKKLMKYLGLCKDNAHLLLGLVNSLLDLNQLRQGKLRLNPAKIKIKQVMSDVMRLFVFQCKSKGIYLDLSFSEDIPVYIYSDENRLKQILINLIGNALKFTLKGGITVDVSQDSLEKEYLEISVSDTGIGIKEEDKDKLFQMYEKIEHGRNVNKNGVGLGLTISNTLACLLSGKADERAIQVESTLNKGSKFSFRILKDLNHEYREKLKDTNEPLECLENSEGKLMDSFHELHIPKEFSPKSSNQCGYRSKMQDYTFFNKDTDNFLSLPKKSSADQYMLTALSTSNLRNDLSPGIIRSYNDDSPSIQYKCEKERILVVDDNMFNLLVAENIIKELGYAFKAARSGHEAIEIVKSKAKESQAFKAILMDCQMPVMDGFETAKILKNMMQKGEVQETPIIALTANDGEEDIKQCYESGMIGHLSKPLFANALFKILMKFS